MASTNTNYGQCRCCLSVGHHKNIRKKYYWNGTKEIYSDLFAECFNLYISSNQNISNLICKSCIVKLRTANAFRIEVQRNEQKLLEALGGKQTLHVNVLEDILENNEQIVGKIIQDENLEIPSISVKAEPMDCYENSDDLSVFEDENISYSLSPKYTEKRDYVELEKELLSRHQQEQLKLPTRDSLYVTCFKYVSCLDSMRGEIIRANDIAKLIYSSNEKPVVEEKNKFFSEKTTHLHNIITIIKHSNVAPFKSHRRSGIACFYCKSAFGDLAKLRQHQAADHDIDEIRKVINLYGDETLVVYVDVTDLKCSVCGEAIPKLGELKKHLEKAHKIDFYPTQQDRIIPYKLAKDNNFECQSCGFTFVTFGAIERHMNTHFRNYICKTCGSGYVTRSRLKTHFQTIHYEASHTCGQCGKVYNTKQKLYSHINTVHKNQKRFKCTICMERFAEYFQRQKHLVTVHGETPLSYRCNVCERVFDKKYFLSRHMKREHLEEKDFQCDVCTYRCFTKTELRDHMIKHTGERIHDCAVCKKSFARKKTLKEHMRIHNNDRRFSCDVCGAAFIQKCSLKGHMKTHHFENYNMPLNVLN